MTIQFSKYQGTGNDFIIIDNRSLSFPKENVQLVSRLCDRKFGIGADGLILLENHPTLDFEMVYYNADGHPSSMCGNGGRCVAAFAKAKNIISNHTTFKAVDGQHKASIDAHGLVHLQMQDVSSIKIEDGYSFVDTGSPHHVLIKEDVQKLDVYAEGAAIRHSDLYAKEGVNVNFVTPKEANTFAVRTYERGVEDETLSCGTGVTAVALAMYENGMATSNEIELLVQGGKLRVSFKKGVSGYTEIYLIGPASIVFNGSYLWNH